MNESLLKWWPYRSDIRMNTRDDDSTRATEPESNEPVTARILRTVAAYSNRSITELPPLFDVIDPVALDAIFAPAMDGSDRSEVSVQFKYAGFQIDVSTDSSVSVERADGYATKGE